MVSINDISDRNIYADLLRYFRDQGYHVTILSPIERRHKKKTYHVSGPGYKIIRPRTLNIQKVNKVEKLASTLLIDTVIKRTIKSNLKKEHFDLLLYSTPPITLTKSVKYAKMHFGCKTYLLLKDIFPQNAVDLEMIKRKSLFYFLFRKIEEDLYALSDRIGCMSDANVKFLLDQNPTISKSIVEVAPNSINAQENNWQYIDRSSLGIARNTKVFIYGGNLGRPQGIPFLVRLLEKFKNDERAYFIIIGSGTESEKLNKWYTSSKPNNVLIKSQLPKPDYDKYVRVSDVGMIFLDHRFTIPNYPSRLLAYMEAKKPIIAFTDTATDIGSNARIRGYGDWAYSGDIKMSCNLLVSYIEKEPSILKDMGENGYKFFKTNYQPKNTFDKIISVLNKKITK